MPWATPTFPEEQSEPAALLPVRDATLSRVEHGPLRTMSPPTRWLRGAVYDADGKLVKESQKIGGFHGHNWVPADPGRIQPRDGAERLAGRWLYGGHWMQQFGHFILETVSTLWPDDLRDGGLDGLVFHKYLKRPWAQEPWQSRLLELSGYGDLPVRVVDGKGSLAVEELLVPTRSVVANGWATPDAVTVWDRIVAGAGGAGPPSGRRVFLSRAGHNIAVRAGGKEPRSTPDHDLALERVFADAGFAVVRPESLSVDEQVRLAAGANVLAGLSGSALHLSAFAPTATRVLELGDDRSPHRPVPMQLLVDAARGHGHAFVEGGIDAAAVGARLVELGLA